jgi:hypothetical protein
MPESRRANLEHPEGSAKPITQLGRRELVTSIILALVTSEQETHLSPSLQQVWRIIAHIVDFGRHRRRD